MNKDASDKAWRELQSFMGQMHAKYFGDDFHKVEFNLPDEDDLPVTATFRDGYNPDSPRRVRR